jgi:type 1 glutamine amidotransferase
MNKISYLILTLSVFTLTLNLEAKMKALILDGQNWHIVWPKSTVMMKQYLEESGLFEVDVARTQFTWNGEKRERKWLPLAGIGPTEDLPEPKADPDYKPNFEDYDVVISNLGFRAANWPKETEAAFDQYMKQGGGFVSVHSADNCFGHWDAYNRIIGVGGWGGRKPNMPGAYVYYTNEGELVRDEAPGPTVGKHGRRHSFPITVRVADHPITKGLPSQWITTEDECYALLRGPAEELTILATGKDQNDNAPTDRHEPMLMVIDYGEGRTFHTTLGHDTPAYECVGFITTFLRGTEWAATGKVTQPIPADFPTAEESSRRTFQLKK